MAGRQTPFIALIVPCILVFIVDGKRGVKQTWPVALVSGVAFGAAQFVTSNYFAVELTDVVAAVVTVAGHAAHAEGLAADRNRRNARHRRSRHREARTSCAIVVAGARTAAQPPVPDWRLNTPAPCPARVPRCPPTITARNRGRSGWRSPRT